MGTKAALFPVPRYEEIQAYRTGPGGAVDHGDFPSDRLQRLRDLEWPSPAVPWSEWGGACKRGTARRHQPRGSRPAVFQRCNTVDLQRPVTGGNLYGDQCWHPPRYREAQRRQECVGGPMIGLRVRCCRSATVPAAAARRSRQLEDSPGGAVQPNPVSSPRSTPRGARLLRGALFTPRSHSASERCATSPPRVSPVIELRLCRNRKEISGK